MLKQKASSASLHDPHSNHGLRAHLNNLIPKHSYFRATVHVHQIDSIPFVSGHFAVRWKFKNVHSLPSARQGLLGIVKTRSKNGDRRQRDDLDTVPLDSSLPSLVVSNTERDPPTPRVSSVSTTSSGPPIYSEPVSLSNSLFSSNSANTSRTTLHLPISTPTVSSATPVPPSPTQLDGPPGPTLLTSTAPARGITPHLVLKDHSVHWNHTLSTVIRFDVERHTGYLLPCPFKLVVMQRVESDDSMGLPQNPRLGAVYLNLSEYVGQGSVGRRYLLRESRTNATLKLTIELEYISGEAQYIAPPLPKGEILNGLAGYLDSGLHRTRGHGVDMYGPYRDQEELELDLFGIRRPNSRPWAPQLRHGYDSDGSDSDSEAPAFDVERLPLAYGTKTTETLIEAIFNPVRTTERRCESPFTVYVPPPCIPSRAKSGDRDPVPLATQRTTSELMRPEEVASVYSAESSSGSSGSGAVSRSSHSQNSSEYRSSGSARVKEWWRKMASRPETPTTAL